MYIEINMNNLCILPPINKFNKILEYGTFFFPATKHYGTIGSSVQCDRCHRANLKACVGYENMDLCLNCVEVIVNNDGDNIYLNDISECYSGNIVKKSKFGIFKKE
jgi:hypothetical protein